MSDNKTESRILFSNMPDWVQLIILVLSIFAGIISSHHSNSTRISVLEVELKSQMALNEKRYEKQVEVMEKLTDAVNALNVNFGRLEERIIKAD